MVVEEAIVRIVAKMFPEDFKMQKELEKVCIEVLYDYEINKKSTELMISDIPEKAQLFLGTKRLEGLSPQTLKNYKYELVRFSKVLNRTVASITSMDLKMYFASMQGINNNTLSTRITVIKSFFTWLLDEEYIIKNPTSKIKKPKVPKRLRKPLNRDQMEIVKDACETERERALIEFMVSSGCRANEISKLKIADINFHDNSANVIGKGDKERVVRFSPAAKLALNKYLESRDDECKYMFRTILKPYKNMEVRAIQRVIEKLKKKTGIEAKFSPHVLRHTFCTNSVNSGMNIVTIQSLMGHQELSTTQRYFDADIRTTKYEYERSM